MLVEARELIDRLEYEVAVRDSQLAAQRDYYVVLLDAKDRRVETLEDLLKEALKRGDRKIWLRAIDVLAGYGVRAATER